MRPPLFPGIAAEAGADAVGISQQELARQIVAEERERLGAS